MSLVTDRGELYGMKRGNSAAPTEDEQDFLSNIIKTLNETYGLNLSDADRQDFETMQEKVEADTELQTFFNPANSKENIRDKFNEKLDTALLDFINTKLELYNKLSEDKANTKMKQLWFNAVYDALMKGQQGGLGL